MVKLSVVIPTMNREDYLEEILDTIPNNIPVYISDNGHYLKEDFNEKYSNVKITYSEEILEMYDNWNRVIKFSESDFVVLPSDDDLYTTKAFDEILNVINENPENDVFIFGHYYIDEKGKKIGEWKPNAYENLLAPHGFEKFKYGVEARWPSIVLRKTLIEKLNYFNVDIPFAGDSEFLQKALLYGKTLFIPKIISKYRVWSNNATSLNQATLEWRASIVKWTSSLKPLIETEYNKINKNFELSVYEDEILAQNIIAGGYLLYNNSKFDDLINYLNDIECPTYALSHTKEAYRKLCLRAENAVTECNKLY